MSDNIAIFLENAYRDTNIPVTGSSEHPLCPIERLQDPDPAMIWQTDTGGTVGSPEWLKFDFNGKNHPNAVAFHNHDFTAGAALKRQENATDVWTGPSIDQTLTIPQDLFYYATATRPFNTFGFLFSDSSYRYKRFTFVDTSLSVLRFGIICLGPVVQFETNFATDWEIEYEDNSERIKVIAGQVHTRRGKKRRVFKFKLRLANIDDRQAAGKLALYGTSRETFILFSPVENTQRENASLTVYGRFRRLPALDEVLNFGGADDDSFSRTDIHECEFEEIP